MRQFRQKLKRAQRKEPGGEDPGAEDLTARVRMPAPRIRNTTDKGQQPDQPGKQQESGPGHSGEGGQGAISPKKWVLSPGKESS